VRTSSIYRNAWPWP